MKDRIQIDGVWYIKENKQEPLDIIFYDGAVYEDDDYCIEATRHKGFHGIYLEIDNKNTGKKEYVDNEDYLKDVINGEAVCFMNGNLLRNFLINLNWIE